MNTTLKNINFGFNKYCGPTVLSALTGESTDRCADIIGAISGKKEIKAVQVDHLLKALEWLRFGATKIDVGSMLYGVFTRIVDIDGLYIILVPHHVIAVEINQGNIYLIDNHSKSPLAATASARLTQRVVGVYKLEKKAEPTLLRREIEVIHSVNKVEVYRKYIHQDEADNHTSQIGSFRYTDYEEFKEIVEKLEAAVTLQAEKK